MQKTNAFTIPNSQASPLIPQRLDVIDLLHSLCGEYKRVFFLYANAIFDADAHAAEVGWVSVCVGNVDAAATGFHQRSVRMGIWVGGAYGSIVTHCRGCNFVFRDWPGVSWTSKPM